LEKLYSMDKGELSYVDTIKVNLEDLPKEVATNVRTQKQNHASTGVWSVLTSPTLILPLQEAPILEDSSEIAEVQPSECVLKDKLGEGAFAVVYKALWRGMNVVVKKFKVECDWTPQEFEKLAKYFKREIQNLRISSHSPFIVQMMGFCSAPFNFFLVLEYMSDGSLDKMIHDKKVVPAKLIQRFTWQVAKGMQILHKSKIIHRDLHTGNVLIDLKTMTAKVSDFGLSRNLSNSGSNFSRIRHYRYGAPELFRNDPYSLPADVYQFGVFVYELLTCDIYFSDISVYSVGSHVAKGIRPTIPPREELYPIPNLDNVINEKQYDFLCDLVCLCWDNEPTVRPEFDNIVKKLELSIEGDNNSMEVE